MVLNGEQSIKKMNRLRGNPSLQIILVMLVIPVTVILTTKILPERDNHGNIRHEKESQYNYIRVVDDNSIRTLLFTKELRAKIQSAIHLELQDTLVLEYSQMVFASIAFVQQPQRILVVERSRCAAEKEFKSVYNS